MPHPALSPAALPQRLLALLRNAIPLAGVFWLGWSPLQYALLFLADACLRPATLGASKLLRDFGSLAEASAPGWTERLDAVVTIFAVCLFLAALLFAVFGVPLFVLLFNSPGWSEELREPAFRWGALALLACAAVQSVSEARRLGREPRHEATQQHRFATAMALLLGTYLCAFVATLLGGWAWRGLALLLAVLLTVVDWHPDLGARLWPQSTRR